MSFRVRQLREEKPRRPWPWKKALLAILTMSRPVLHLYRDWKRERTEERARSTFFKRAVLVIIAILIGVAILGGIGYMATSIKELGLKSVATIAGTPPPQDENGFTNLLLLGQGDEAGQDLIDTIIVASIDATKTKSVVLLSLPRDLYLLHTERMGKGKLNSMYRDMRGYFDVKEGMEKEEASIAAMKELASEIGQIVDLQIHHIVKVDFEGFVQAVDAIEGVDIDVPEDIVDTEYPDGNYGYETFEVKAGLNHFDGATALKFVRSRHTTSDFGRSARQQQLLAAMAEKGRSLGIAANPGKIKELYQILSEHVETTMSLREMIGMAGFAGDLDRSRLITMQLSDRNGLYDGYIEPGGFLYAPPRDLFDGVAVLLPVSIPEFPVTWKQIRTLGAILFHEREAYLAHPQISVLNAGARSGLARRLGTELIRYGFNVGPIANASLTEDLATSTVALHPEGDPEFSKFLASLLHLETSILPTGLPPEEVAEVTIILGEDYEYVPLQDLLLTLVTP